MRRVRTPRSVASGQQSSTVTSADTDSTLLVNDAIIGTDVEEVFVVAFVQASGLRLEHIQRLMIMMATIQMLIAID